MKILHPATYLGATTSYHREPGLWVSIANYHHGAALDMAPHAHVNPHFTLLLQGGTLEKSRRGQFERRAGEVVFFHAGEEHQNSHTLLPSKNINLEFSAPFLRSYDLEEATLARAARLYPGVAFLPLRVYKELLAGDAYSADSVVMLLLGVLNQAPNTSRVPPAWVERVRQLLHEQWGQPVSLGQLAMVAGVHPVTISKYFPRYFSATLGEYVRRLKVTKALALIKNSPLSLTEVAYACGFCDQIHFTRTFQRQTGLLPKEYKKL
jgi:AraC family transcriptional regulator